MIRPMHSSPPISQPVVPAFDIPRAAKRFDPQFQLSSHDLDNSIQEGLLAGSESKPDVTSAAGGEQDGDNASVETRPLGKSDRHPLSDQRSLADTIGGAEPLREAFRDFVGQTLFGQMLSSMRSTVGKPAYFHGGRAEEIFSEQLDQVLVEQITEASASTVADPMFELFIMQRSR
jgi:flagellar protein FlgJ